MSEKTSMLQKVIFGVAAGATSFAGISIIDGIKTNYEQSVLIEHNQKSVQEVNQKLDEVLTKVIEGNVITKQNNEDIKEIKRTLNDESN